MSPYNKGASVSDDTETLISGCSFSNIYDAYAIKDIYTGSAVISNCTFSNLSGGVYFEGPAFRGEISIVENTFTGADAYAEAGKGNTPRRHPVQQFVYYGPQDGDNHRGQRV